MFYRIKVKDYIRVPPQEFIKDSEEAVLESVRKKYSGFVEKNVGIVITASNVETLSDGVVIPGDGAVYYETVFSLLTFKPEMQEVMPSFIRDITDFGCFTALGPIDGLIHISQTMSDFVSFSKDKVLQGKKSHRSLKVGDNVNARVVAISFKDPANPKIGLTMRQAFLGKDEWVKEDLEKIKR